MYKRQLGIGVKEIEKFATRLWDVDDMAADIASGTQLCDGMVIIPCTMNTVAKMAHGIADNLLLRAFDVMLKGNRSRRIIIVPRETPLNENHLENLLRIKRMGVTIIPPVPAFYYHPKSIQDMVDFIVALILDQFGIAHTVPRWRKP